MYFDNDKLIYENDNYNFEIAKKGIRELIIKLKDKGYTDKEINDMLRFTYGKFPNKDGGEKGV